jgi:hypothetical protein
LPLRTSEAIRASLHREPTSSPAAKRLARAIGKALPLILAVVCLSYFGRELWLRWPALVRLPWSSKIFGCIALGVAFQSASALLDGWSWAWVLRALGIGARSRTAIGIFGVSQFAKYLPGNIGQHVGRIELSRREGWQLGRVAASLLLEAGFGVAAGAVFGAAGLVVLEGEATQSQLAGAVVLGAGAVAGIATLLVILARAPAPFAKWFKLEEPLRVPNQLLLAYFAVHVVSYVAVGAGLFAVLTGLGASSGETLWKIPFVVAAGWLAGYMTPGAPAGLGVREVVVTALLTPQTGAEVAVAATLLWRVVALLTDVVVFVGALLLRGRRPLPP